MNAPGDPVRLRLVWDDAESAQPLHANQALAQLGGALAGGKPDGILLTFGHAPTPTLMADRDPEGTQQRIEQLAATGLKVNVLGQFHFSRALLDELITLLQETAAKYDQAEESASLLARPKE